MDAGDGSNESTEKTIVLSARDLPRNQVQDWQYGNIHFDDLSHWSNTFTRDALDPLMDPQPFAPSQNTISATFSPGEAEDPRLTSGSSNGGNRVGHSVHPIVPTAPFASYDGTGPIESAPPSPYFASSSTSEEEEYDIATSANELPQGHAWDGLTIHNHFGTITGLTIVSLGSGLTPRQLAELLARSESDPVTSPWATNLESPNTAQSAGGRSFRPSRPLPAAGVLPASVSPSVQTLASVSPFQPGHSSSDSDVQRFGNIRGAVFVQSPTGELHLRYPGQTDSTSGGVFIQAPVGTIRLVQPDGGEAVDRDINSASPGSSRDQSPVTMIGSVEEDAIPARTQSASFPQVSTDTGTQKKDGDWVMLDAEP